MSGKSEPIEQTHDEEDDRAQQQEQQNKPKKKKKKEKEKGNQVGFDRKLKGAKNLMMLLFKKFEKACTGKTTRPPPPPFPYSEDVGKSCHLCFVQPRVSLDPPLIPNPDAKTATYHDFVRSFIERNDFYSPECNVHI